MEAFLVAFWVYDYAPRQRLLTKNADLLGKRGAKLRTLDFWGRAIVVDDIGGPARKRAGEQRGSEAVKRGRAAAALWPR